MQREICRDALGNIQAKAFLLFKLQQGRRGRDVKPKGEDSPCRYRKGRRQETSAKRRRHIKGTEETGIPGCKENGGKIQGGSRNTGSKTEKVKRPLSVLRTSFPVKGQEAAAVWTFSLGLSALTFPAPSRGKSEIEYLRVCAKVPARERVFTKRLSYKQDGIGFAEVCKLEGVF